MAEYSSDKLLIAKAEDVIKLSEKYSSIRRTEFLTPSEAEIIKDNHLKGFDSKQMFYGGYEGAERCMFVSYPDFYDDISFDDIISVIEVTGRDISKLSHRDYLGSLMGLGIKREKIGDIVILEDRTLVFVCEDISDYIIINLTKIGNCGIKVRIISNEDFDAPEIKYTEFSGTVQSLRLDAVLSVALKTSRNKAAMLIKAEKVQVNFKLCQEPSAFLKEGTVFSVRGFGKFELAMVNGETKKGRISITIKKFV